MTVAADILAACAAPCSKGDIVRATRFPNAVVDEMLLLLVRGCYLIVDGDRYRQATRDEKGVVPFGSTARAAVIRTIDDQKTIRQRQQ